MEHNDNIELEEMRQMLAILKTKLSKEEIINERLIRESTKAKARLINRQAWASVVSGLFVILLVPIYFIPKGFSIAFGAATIVFMVGCLISTWHMHRNVNSHTMNGDLLTVAKVMRKLKHNYQKWLKLSIIPTLIWFLWLDYEVYILSDNLSLALYSIGSGLLGGIVGSIIAIRMHKKVVRACDEIVKQIEPTNDSDE